MNVALLGTGVLGYPMAEKVCERGHKLWAYNRTREKCKGLAQNGAVICSSADEALKEAECILLILSDAKAIERVLLDKAIKTLKGKTVIQMGTISSKESRTFQQKVSQRGGDYFECPVLGSKKEAKDASLILMVGASEEQYNHWSDFLKMFGPHPRLIGPVGSAASLKLALNHLIAAHAACFSLSLGLVEKNEVDVDVFMSILNDSSLVAPMYAKKLPNWLKRNYENPNFTLKHLIKDVDLVIKEAEGQKINTKVVQSIRDVLKQSVKEGLADKDYSAVYNTINKI